MIARPGVARVRTLLRSGSHLTRRRRADVQHDAAALPRGRVQALRGRRQQVPRRVRLILY